MNVFISEATGQKFSRFLQSQKDAKEENGNPDLKKFVVEEDDIYIRKHRMRRTAENTEVFSANDDKLAELLVEFYNWCKEEGE